MKKRFTISVLTLNGRTMDWKANTKEEADNLCDILREGGGIILSVKDNERKDVEEE